MIKIATFNVENLFARPKAFARANHTILNAFRDVNIILAQDNYSRLDKKKIIELFIILDIYYKNDQNAVRKRRSSDPKWAWLRKNRGHFDKQPRDNAKNLTVIANGRDDWIGWVALAKESSNDKGIQFTGKVIKDVDADILAVVEAENRPSLARFNREILKNMYQHVMLVDGNDFRGIDVGILTKQGFEIATIISNIDLEDDIGTVFSRDCPQYEIRLPNNQSIHILINHFKSQSGGGGAKRRRQAIAVRKIVDDLVSKKKHVIVLGDLNEGPPFNEEPAKALAPLYKNNSPLKQCFSLKNFDIGKRPGTFSSCTLRNRLDYIFISKSLERFFIGGGIERRGLRGKNKSLPIWEIYPGLNSEVEQASDHAAVYIELDFKR